MRMETEAEQWHASSALQHEAWMEEQSARYDAWAECHREAMEVLLQVGV
jgi:hypothetical protein